MQYPQNLLSDGEQVEFMLRPHFRALFAPALVLIAVVFIGGWLYTNTSIDVIHYGILIIGAIIIVPFVLVKFARWLTTQYVFTNRRIITRMGLIARNGRDMPLAKVNNVTFDVPIMGRILNYGRLIIDSANADGNLVIEDVPNVEMIQRRIYDLYEKDDRRRRTADGGFIPSDV